MYSIYVVGKGRWYGHADTVTVRAKRCKSNLRCLGIYVSIAWLCTYVHQLSKNIDIEASSFFVKSIKFIYSSRL